MKTSLLFLIPSPPSLSKSFFRVPNSKLTSWNLGKVKEYNQWSLKPWKSKTFHGIILTKLFKFTQFPVLTGIWFEPTNSLICQQTLVSSFRDFACSEQQVWAASEMWHDIHTIVCRSASAVTSFDSIFFCLLILFESCFLSDVLPDMIQIWRIMWLYFWYASGCFSLVDFKNF